MFVACDGLVEGLAIGKAAEVERGAPAVFVEVGGKIVVSAVISYLPMAP